MGCVLLGDSVRPAHLLHLVADGVAGRAYLLIERIDEREEILRRRPRRRVRRLRRRSVVVESGSQRAPDESARMARLTARELDVLSLMAEGGVERRDRDAASA